MNQSTKKKDKYLFFLPCAVVFLAAPFFLYTHLQNSPSDQTWVTYTNEKYGYQVIATEEPKWGQSPLIS